ncbi:MAG: oxygenase MpaB family protein [Propionibacteriaceae bacterium]|nr:oxygenase MpaB family protein [Propionibacteriaceae bacterium]
MSPVGPVRVVQRALGEALRSKVAGADAGERGQQIWGKPGERWFSTGDPIWRVHEDASMFPGGVAALLLQSLHPLAMAGVAGHSGYKGDPWGRLHRTSNYIAVTTYATIPDATALIDQVRAVHERVRGKDHRGRPYRASDPHLLAWIHAAEIASFLAAYRAYGPAPLSDADADTYVAQAGLPARLLGVVDPPATVAELDGVLASYRPELELTPQASETIDFLLRTPPLPWAARPGYWMLAAGGIAVLPDWARELIGTRVPVRLGRGVGRLGAATVRWGLAGVEGGRRSAPPPA